MFSHRIILALAAAGLATGGAAQEPAKQPAQKAKTAKYCLEYEKVTGSRLRGSECLTKAEWAKRGVDIDEMTKQ